MYRDMHPGVYNLTRRLGEVVGALNPGSLLKQPLVQQLYQSTLATYRQPQLKPA